MSIFSRLKEATVIPQMFQSNPDLSTVVGELVDFGEISQIHQKKFHDVFHFLQDYLGFPIGTGLITRFRLNDLLWTLLPPDASPSKSRKSKKLLLGHNKLIHKRTVNNSRTTIGLEATAGSVYAIELAGPYALDTGGFNLVSLRYNADSTLINGVELTVPPTVLVEISGPQLSDRINGRPGRRYTTTGIFTSDMLRMSRKLNQVSRGNPDPELIKIVIDRTIPEKGDQIKVTNRTSSGNHGQSEVDVHICDEAITQIIVCPNEQIQFPGLTLTVPSKFTQNLDYQPNLST